MVFEMRSDVVEEEARPDELFDAVRFERVTLTPATVGGRAAVTTSRQTDAHHDTADD